MRIAIDILRWALWLEGVVFLGGTLVLMAAASRSSIPAPAPVYFGVLLYMLVTFVMALHTANQMTQGRPTARRLGLVTGILNLPLMPVFTPVGIVAICLMAMPRSEEILRHRSLPPWRVMAAFVPALAMIVYRSQQPR